MKRDICILFPEVNNEISLLYKDLYNKTDHNRKLANLLYALAQQLQIKDLFQDSDYNLLGEIDAQKLLDKLDVLSILDASVLVESEAKALGAIKSNGDPIYYDNIMTIATKVKDFNDTHDKIKAVIKYDDNGYHIEVDTLNATNFNFNNQLENRLNLYDDFITYLLSKGFTTTFSHMTTAMINPLNIYSAIDNVKQLAVNTKFNRYLSAALLDLLSTDPLAQRIITLFGDDAPLAIALVSGFTYANSVSVDPYWQEEIKRFITAARRKIARSIDGDEIKDVIETAKTRTRYEDTSYGTNGLTVQLALNELYRVYGLDKDSKNFISMQVKKVSDAANKLITILLLLAEQLKGSSKKIALRKLKKVQDLLEDSQFLSGIVSIFEDLKNVIDEKEALFRRFTARMQRTNNSMLAIGALSDLTLEQLDVVNVYRGIMKDIANIDSLVNDSAEAKELVDAVKRIALEYSLLLDTIEKLARLKQAEIVYAFLKIYWGDKPIKDLDGNMVKLFDEDDPSAIMNMAVKDPNFLDRFIYAMNTSNDEMAGLMAEAVKRAHEERDAKLRTVLKEVRVATKKLYDSGSNTKFMYELDENGYPEWTISNYDFAKYEKEKKEYEDLIKADPNIPKSQYSELLSLWEKDHNEYDYFEYTDYLTGAQKKLKVRVPIYKKDKSVEDRLSPALYDYYQKMMDLKASVIARMEDAPNELLFSVIETSISSTQAMTDTGGDPKKIFNILKNKIVDRFVIREDDTEFGFFRGNNVREVKVDAQGRIINKMPIFYTHKLKDRSRVSTDYSKSLLQFMAASENYIELNKIHSAMLLTKDYILTQRPHNDSTDNNSISAQISQLGKSAYVTVATKRGVDTSLGGMMDDYFEKTFYGKSRRDEGYLFGSKISTSKLLDTLVGYSSVTGLAVNVLGAEANLLVGKLQMLIESGLGFGGEFFGVKDMIKAEGYYFAMLPSLMGEINSNVKSSKLRLMLDYFNVKDDFEQRVKDTDFYKNGFNRIIGNANLFFLYGLGEHLLHAEGMIAVLLNKRNNVKDASGKEVPLFKAFEVVKDETGNGELRIKEGYTNLDGTEITTEQLRKIKRKIAYVNKSMHGAFGKDDKGLAHRYAIFRVILNFRQWMPAHFSRRFRMSHFDTDLGEYREGYYISAFKFLKGVWKDIRKGRLEISARWNSLEESLRYNLKRAGAETIILGALWALIALAGEPKDHKGNWARRHLIYMLKRLDLETLASTPVALTGFTDNLVKLLNSPFALLNTMDKAMSILDVTKLWEEVESGKDKGENKFVYNFKRKAPFVSQIYKLSHLAEDADMFALFN